MKKVAVSFLYFLFANVVFGRTAAYRIGGDEVPLWALLVSAIFALMFVHIVCDLLFKPFKKSYSREYFEIKRIKSPEIPPFSDADAENCTGILREGFSKWGYWDDDLEEKHFLPFTRKEYLTAKKALRRVEKIAPTSPEVISAFNNCVDIYNKASTRKFDGSKTLIVCALLFIVIMAFVCHAYSSYFVSGLCLFIAASCVPNWLGTKRANTRKGAHVSSRIIGGLFSTTASMPTYVTVTKWSDGSVTKTSDDSATLVMFIISLLCILLMIFFLPFIAFISYLRNYLLYL